MSEPTRWAFLSVVPLRTDEENLLPPFTESSIFKAKHRIGRDPRCETALERFTVVSSEHCYITTTFEPISSDDSNKVILRAFLTDNSTNGTLVNKRTLKRGESLELEHGMEISMRGKATPFKLVFHQVALAREAVAGIKRYSLTSPTPGSEVKLENQEELARLRIRVQQVEDALTRESNMHEDTKKKCSAEIELKTRTLSTLHEDLGKREREKRAVEALLVEETFKHTLLQEQHTALKLELEQSAERCTKLETNMQALQRSNANAETALLEANQAIKLQEEAFDLERATLKQANETLTALFDAKQGENRKLSAQLEHAALQREAEHLKHVSDMADLNQDKEDAQSEAKKHLHSLQALQSTMEEVKAQMQQVEQRFAEEQLARQLVQEEFEQRQIASAQDAAAMQAKMEKLTQTKFEAMEECERVGELHRAATLQVAELETKLDHETRRANSLANKVQELHTLRTQFDALNMQVKKYKEQALQAEDDLQAEIRLFQEREDAMKRQLASHADDMERVKREAAVRCGELETTIAGKIDALTHAEMTLTNLLPVLRLAKANSAAPPHTLLKRPRFDEEEEVERQPTPQLVFDSPCKRADTLLCAETELQDGEEDSDSTAAVKRMRTVDEEEDDEDDEDDEVSSADEMDYSSTPEAPAVVAATEQDEEEQVDLNKTVLPMTQKQPVLASTEVQATINGDLFYANF